MPKHLLVLFVVLLGSMAEASNLFNELKIISEINTETGKTDGIQRVQKWIATELKPLGFESRVNEDGLLIAERGGESAKVVTVLLHVDTVLPSRPVVAEGDVVQGSGVMDAKGGIIVALEGLRRFLAKQKPTYGIRIVSSPAEEVGSPKLIQQFQELSKKTFMVLGFEPALDDGSIITSRRGDRWYKISVTGKEAHAGRAHRDGVNACRDLAIKLEKLSKLTDYAKDVTVSIGHFEGGKDKYNVVCGKAEAKVDVRFSTSEDGARIKTAVERVLKTVDVKGADVTFEVVDDLPSFKESKDSKKMINLYLAAVASSEEKPTRATKSGGGADSNFFARDGVIIIDGLGPYGAKMHTEAEFLYLPSLESRAEAFHQFLNAINK